jgi:uncharacterized membrane protein YbhN (UPF0104 family)
LISRDFQKGLFAVAKLLVAAVVAYFIARAVLRARDDFAAQHFSLRNLRWSWLLAAGTCYLVGVLPMALFWNRVLNAMGQHPPLWATLAAHYIGQLGKYVPGKAMVLALRLGLIRKYGVEDAAGALSIFTETMTMMSVGAMVAVILLASQFRDRLDLLLLAAGMVLLVGAPTWPPLLRMALRWLYRRRFGVELEDHATRRLTWRVFLPGWCGVAAGWLLLGLSMWATLRGLGLPTTDALPLTELPRITAALGVSVVAGFLSMLPAGVGVREWVLHELLAGAYGEVVSIVGPILVRLVWLVSELAVFVILYLSRLGTRNEAS